MIRLVEKTDYFEVEKLAMDFCKESKCKLTFDRGTFYNSFNHSLTTPDLTILVYEVKGEVKGFLSGVITKTLFSTTPVAAELSWYVDPKFRGGTGGIKLVKAYEQWATSRGCEVLTLTNINGLGDLDDMYTRMGYVLTEKTYVKET